MRRAGKISKPDGGISKRLGYKEGKMTLEEIKAWLEENKETDEVKTFIESLSNGSHEITSEEFMTYIQSENGEALFQAAMKPFLEKEGDRRATDAVKKYERDTLPKKVDTEVAKKIREINPPESEEQREIRELTARFEDSENARKRDKLMFEVLKKAEEKGVPAWIIENAGYETLDEFTEYIDRLSAYHVERDKKTVNDVLKTKETPKDNAEPVSPKIADLAKKSREEIMALEASGKLNEILRKTG